MRYIVFALFLLLPVSSYAGLDGIQSLNSVSQTRSDNANDEALSGASRSRDNIRQQKDLRRQQSSIDGVSKKTNPNTALNDAKLQDIERKIGEIQQKLDSMSGLSREQQQRMRLIMDRMQRADRAASNLMKKHSETSSSIIQNTK